MQRGGVRVRHAPLWYITVSSYVWADRLILPFLFKLSQVLCSDGSVTPSTRAYFLNFKQGINTEYRRIPFPPTPIAQHHVFPTGQHHGQDVVLAMPLATLRPTQGQSLHQHAMGDTALACFGRIPWIDRQGVRRAQQRQSDHVDDDGNNGNGLQPAARGLPLPPTPGSVDDNDRGNPGVLGGNPPSSDAWRGRGRDSSGWPPALRIAWRGAGGEEPLPHGRQRRCRCRRRRRSHWRCLSGWRRQRQWRRPRS